MKYVYALLCVLGTLLPYGVFLPWLMDYGVDIPLFITEASQSRIAAYAWLDVLIAALALLVFIWVEGSRQGIGHLWLAVLATCTVGVSSGLPLFLLMREIRMEKRVSEHNA